jgi:hypothetical protein
MKKVIIAVILAAAATSASAFFGADDNQSGYGKGLLDSTFDGRGRGAANGDVNAVGDFSMTINASGKAHSNMAVDLDAASNNRFNGETDLNTKNTPAYYTGK